MNFVNSVVLEGNVVRDPVVKVTERGFSGCFFSIASDRRYMKGEESITETSFFAVETWGQLAEECAVLCAHGKFVRVIGRLKQDRWVDAEGKTRTKIKVIAEHVVSRSSAKRPADSAANTGGEAEDQAPVFAADPDSRYDSERLAEAVAF